MPGFSLCLVTYLLSVVQRVHGSSVHFTLYSFLSFRLPWSHQSLMILQSLVLSLHPSESRFGYNVPRRKLIHLLGYLINRESYRSFNPYGGMN